MTTCRQVAIEALRALNALAPGDDMVVDEGIAALEAIQALANEYWEGMGPLTDVDVTAAYVPGENERVRVQADDTVAITLPNKIAISPGLSNDYGFKTTTPPAGSSDDTADGLSYRAPRDGSRVEVTYLSSSSDPARYLYRADINTWVELTDLTLDGNLPFNSSYTGHFGALLAQRLAETWPGRFEPTPALQRRIARANHTMLIRPGVVRDPVRATYF